MQNVCLLLSVDSLERAVLSQVPSLFWRLFVCFAGFTRPSRWEGREWRCRSYGECLWLFSVFSLVRWGFFGGWLNVECPPAKWLVEVFEGSGRCMDTCISAVNILSTLSIIFRLKYCNTEFRCTVYTYCMEDWFSYKLPSAFQYNKNFGVFGLMH